MGVDKWESCRLPIMGPALIATVLSGSSEVVKGTTPPVSNCESLPRYGESPEEGGKEKEFQSVESFKEKSWDARVPVKAAEEESENKVGSVTAVLASVVENNAKSQLID
jgi:hypothetical protein